MAIEVDDQWTVLNIVLSRGLFRPTVVKLPFTASSHWDDDVISLDCASYEAFGRRIPPIAVPPRPLSSATPLSTGDARLAGALVETASRRASHLILRRGSLVSGHRILSVADVALEGGVIKLAAQWRAMSVYRRDSELLAAVRDALVQHPYLNADDLRGLSVDVVEGTVHLFGNVRMPPTRDRIIQAASAVAGVITTRVDVFDDRQIEIEIGRALDAAGLFRRNRIYIRVNLGEVTVEGFVTGEAVAGEIITVVSAVPGVRSVENRMGVQAGPPAAAGPSPAVGGSGASEA